MGWGIAFFIGEEAGNKMNMTQAAAAFNQSLSSVGSFLTLPWLSPLIMIIGIIIGFVTILVMWNLTQRQINEMRKIENDKKFIGVESLIYELEQNKNWVLQFINDCAKGGHKGKIDNNILFYSWVWNPPQLIAYENYLSVVCGDDEKLAIKIINLYSHLKSCSVIVHFIHELYINNAEGKITKYNESLERICLEIKDSFDDPIKKLKFIAENLHSRNEYKQNSVTYLDTSGSGTAVHSPTYYNTPTAATGLITPVKITAGDKEKIIEDKPPSDKENE